MKWATRSAGSFLLNGKSGVNAERGRSDSRATNCQEERREQPKGVVCERYNWTASHHRVRLLIFRSHGGNSDFNQRAGVDSHQSQFPAKFFRALAHSSDADTDAPGP